MAANGRSNDTKTSRALNRALENPAGFRTVSFCRTTGAYEKAHNKVIAAFGLAQTGRLISRRYLDRAAKPPERLACEQQNKPGGKGKGGPSPIQCSTAPTGICYARPKHAKGNDAQASPCASPALLLLSLQNFVLDSIERKRYACNAESFSSHFPGAA